MGAPAHRPPSHAAPQENDAKRARAEKKAADEIKARLTKEAEIAKLSEALAALGEERERIDGVVERRMRCARVRLAKGSGASRR